MKYQFHILLFCVLVSSSFGFNEVYAIDTLGFEQDQMEINHSAIIYCNDCTVAGDILTATLSGDSDSIPVNLYRISGTSDFASDFVKFCDSGCLSNDFVTAPGDPNIQVAAAGYSPAGANVFGTDTLDPATYGVNALLIEPWSGGLCASYLWDTDGDGICNAWENNQNYPAPCPSSGPGLCIRTSATANPYFLECTPGSTHWSNACPSPTKADLYFEIDYMLGHKPSDATITAVADAFKNSNFVSKNNNGGIQFHAQLNEELPHIDSLAWHGEAGTPGYDQLKYWWFGTEEERGYEAPTEVTTGPWLNNNTPLDSKRSQKAQGVHYIMFAHNISGGVDPNTSGAAESPGNDAIISLGSFDGMVGNSDQQQGTLLHEIGHNLNLLHGGNGDKNCKPNYLSVMSYSLQFPIYAPDRSLDLSRYLAETLTEDALNENTGLRQPGPVRTAAYGPAPADSSITGIPIDWNRNGEAHDNPALPPDVFPDITNFNITDCMASPGDVLGGFKDWNKYRLVLAPVGYLSDSNTDDLVFDPNSVIDDGFVENTILFEITSEDVTEMRTQRIDTILSDLDNIPDGDFVGDAVVVRESYKNDLDQVKILIRQNVGGNNTMQEAYKKLDGLFLKLDGLGDDDIIKSESRSLTSVRDLVGNVITAQSHSLGGAKDFLNVGRDSNMRPHVIPAPNPPEVILTPYQQVDDLAEFEDPLDLFVCKDGLDLAIKASNTTKLLCLTPDTKSQMIQRGLAMPAPYDRES